MYGRSAGTKTSVRKNNGVLLTGCPYSGVPHLVFVLTALSACMGTHYFLTEKYLLA